MRYLSPVNDSLNRPALSQLSRQDLTPHSSVGERRDRSVTVTEALATLDAVGGKRLGDIAGRIFSDPYAYYHGWPDLMVMDGSGQLIFWEVKTTDRLRAAQIITIMDMRDAASLDMRIMKLKRPRGN